MTRASQDLSLGRYRPQYSPTVCSDTYPFQIREQWLGVLSVVFELALGVWFYAHCSGFAFHTMIIARTLCINWTLIDSLPGDPGLLYS